MSLFKDMLGSDESLFRNPIALDYDYQPKLVPYREGEQKQIALAIRPLLQERNGRNCLIHGRPGVGKTIAIKHILNELEEETDEVSTIYINCWQKTSTYKVVLDICNSIGFKFTQNKRTDELFEVVAKIVNRRSAVFVLDEIDKMEDLDIIYWTLEKIYKKSVILITNHPEWLSRLDNRILSRLLPERIEFRPYNIAETTGILEQRKEVAFVPDVFESDAFKMVCTKAFELGDIRTGLYLLKEAGTLAEDKSSRMITADHVSDAIAKLPEFTHKNTDELSDESKTILEIISQSGESRIGDLYKKFTANGGRSAYKTFQRRIKELTTSGLVDAKKITGGSDGSTTMIKKSDGSRKLSEF